MYNLNHLNTYGYKMTGILNACKATRKLKGKEYQEFIEIFYDSRLDKVYFRQPHRFDDFSGDCGDGIILFTAFAPMTMQEIANAIMFNLERYGVKQWG